MAELQDGGVKRLPSEGFSTSSAGRSVPAPAVDRVADHRAAEMGEMDPDLVGPAGVELGADQAGRASSGGPNRFSSQ